MPSLTTNFFDICSPSCTGMGLEILRTVPLINMARARGLRVRLWTFHPLAFDDRAVEIFPLQQGHRPLLPNYDEALLVNRGAVWLPHDHPNGPFVCQDALEAALLRGFRQLDEEYENMTPGAYPARVYRFGQDMFGKEPEIFKEQSCPLYPADSESTTSGLQVVLNLIGAHGREKGLSDAFVACKVADHIGAKFPNVQILLLLHARVCGGQTPTINEPNVRLLIHIDSDSRVSRFLNLNSLVISVEGGLAHSVIYRRGQLVMIGKEDWLKETAYLYPKEGVFQRNYVTSFSENDLIKCISNIISDASLIRK